MATTTLDPPPYAAPIAEDKPAKLGADWIRWFGQLFGAVQSSAQQIGSMVTRTNQSAAITTTAIPLPVIGNGPYRLTGYLQVTTPDGAASSVGLVFGWQKNAIPITKTFTALTGNTTATADSFSVTVPTDQSSALTYATSYSSTTPGQMKYLLIITVEGL